MHMYGFHYPIYHTDAFIITLQFPITPLHDYMSLSIQNFIIEYRTQCLMVLNQSVPIILYNNTKTKIYLVILLRDMHADLSHRSS
jgi:hypothetical protein